MRIAAVMATAMTILTIAGCGAEPRAAGPVRPIDEIGGSYRGFSFGDPVRSAGGKLFPRSPTLREINRDGLPYNIPPPAGYRFGERLSDASAFDELLVRSTRRSGIYLMTVTAAAARTRAGVGIGDPLETVSKRYPAARCGRARGTYGIDDFPLCTVRLRADRYLWIGQDPIRSITLSTVGL